LIFRGFLRAIVALTALALAAPSSGAPLAASQIAALCGNAEDQAHCGRLIEEVQLKRLPGLAERAGDDLKVALFPNGSTTFTDSVAITGAKSFTLWDYLDRINAVVLFTTDGDRTGFLLLQRANGRQIRLPAEPSLSPDRSRLVTADFCATGCDGEVVVWRVDRDGVQKELAWKPKVAWIDATASWKDADTLWFEYTQAGEDKPRTAERGLADAGWVKTTSR
jgi:hypothetical protein